MQGRLTLHVRILVHISQVSSVFLKVNVSAVALIHSRNYQYLVGKVRVLSGVGDIFHCVA